MDPKYVAEMVPAVLAVTTHRGAAGMDEDIQYEHLSKEQLDSIKEQILASIYEDIGRSLVKKILWVAGASILALFAWLVSTGKTPMRF